MSILNTVGKFISDLGKPATFKDGESWERDIENVFFPAKHYNLIHKAHDYHENNKRYVESSLLPDFKFRDLSNKREFYVECKFRSSLLHGKIQWAKDWQYKRYKELKEPVFIALAYQDDKEERCFLLPLNKIKYPALYPSVIKSFEVSFEIVASKKLWELYK
ncbi:MAG: hypothetical protein ACTHMM_13375 [Agriterribacter sp.]